MCVVIENYKPVLRLFTNTNKPLAGSENINIYNAAVVSVLLQRVSQSVGLFLYFQHWLWHLTWNLKHEKEGQRRAMQGGGSKCFRRQNKEEITETDT